jgi:Zn-dependent M32 family carboxypeptidase
MLYRVECGRSSATNSALSMGVHTDQPLFWERMVRIRTYYKYLELVQMTLSLSLDCFGHSALQSSTRAAKGALQG